MSPLRPYFSISLWTWIAPHFRHSTRKHVELAFDVAEEEIGAGHGASWLAGRRGSDHCHPNDDNDPCNGRRKGNATEHRASDRPICCHRAELDRRQRRLGVDSGFHRCVFCQRSLWRLAYARAVRTTQIANAPGGKIFARRGAMDTGHICVGTSARHASGKSALSRTTSIMIQNYSVDAYFVRPPLFRM